MTNSRLIARWLKIVHDGGDRIAIRDDQEAVTFTELGRRAEHIAQFIREKNLQGARIALLVTQGSGWVESFFGIVLSGAIAVPLSHLHPAQEQKWFVETSDAKAIIVSEDLEARITSYQDERMVLNVQALRATMAPSSESDKPRVALGGLEPTHDDDTAVILYTSGTTGKPKGALITHANLAILSELVRGAWGWSTQDTLLHSLPLHHLHGLGISLFVSLLAGGRSIMLSRFDASRVWEELKDSTVLMGVPTMHKKLLDALDAANERDQARWREHARPLRLITSGSAALPSTVSERWRQLTGDYPLERFGMTEIGVGLTNPIDGPRRPGSCGPPLPGMQIRIVGNDGQDVTNGESGEIWIKGPTVFKGYDKNEEATRESFQDGWFRSGDTAQWLEDGYLKILGRTSVDILKSGGYKISALEIEELFREHESVADIAVVGIPDDTWGEIAVAAVLLRLNQAEPSEQMLRDWAKERIASYKVPKKILVFDELPRNPIGKVVKPELTKIVTERLSSHDSTQPSN